MAIICIFAVWIGLTIYTAGGLTNRRIFGRAALAYSIAAFVLPVAMVAYTVIYAHGAIATEETEVARSSAAIGTAIGGSILIALATIFGLFTGIIGSMLAHFTLRKSAA